MSGQDSDLIGAIRAQTLELLSDARTVLDIELDPVPAEPLNHLWDAVTQAMIGDAPSHADRTRLVELLNRIRSLETERDRTLSTRTAPTFARIQSALADLETATTVDALLSVAPEAACGLGFDRALVSTVDGAWFLHSMTVVRDPRWAQEIVAVGREQAPVLDRGIVEYDSVDGARATLVDEVQSNPRVNRALAEVTRSSSYGIAPLLVNGDVVGLLHGDYYFQKRPVGDDDQAILSAFAAGLSQNLARVSVLDNITSLRSQIDQLGQWTSSFSAPAAASAAAARDDGTVLTRREAQIMRMMATGDTNAKIARRLVISEGTVKTHVTRILRKLRAANRAEAVSIWLRCAPAGHSATS